MQIERNDDMELMNAEEAREKAKNSISEETELELQEVNRAIIKEVEKGQFYCWYKKYLHPQTIGLLSGYGYNVFNESNQMNGNLFKIEW